MAAGTAAIVDVSKRCACGAGTIGEALLKRGARAHLVLVNLECNDISDHAKAILHQVSRTRSGCMLHEARRTAGGINHRLCTGRRYRAWRSSRIATSTCRSRRVVATYSTTRVTLLAACNKQPRFAERHENCAGARAALEQLRGRPCRYGHAGLAIVSSERLTGPLRPTSRAAVQHSTLNATVAQLLGGLDTGTELRAAHRSSWSSCVRVGLYKNEIWETSEKISISEISENLGDCNRRPKKSAAKNAGLFKTRPSQKNTCIAPDL